MKFAVFYGVPTYREDNTWLHEELSKYSETRVVEVSDFWYKIGRFRPRSKLGVGIHAIIYFIQAIILIIKTNKDDVVFSRDHGSSLILSCLTNMFAIKRKIVAFNWIEMPKKHYKKIAYYALKNSDYMPVVNDERLLIKIRNEFKLSKVHGFFFPDTYNIKDAFNVPKIKRGKYIFCGGVNNRDWDTVIGVAKDNPDKIFKFAVNRYWWLYRDDDLPNNIQMYFDLSESEYYKLLRGAYLSVVALKEDKVSGLINIIKSHQYGIPCITNNMGVAELYIPKMYKENLIYDNKRCVEELGRKINYIYNLNDASYLQICKGLQRYLKEKFSPIKLVEQLISDLNLQKYL